MKIAFKVKAKNGVLQQFIDERGWTQSDFARHMNVHSSTVASWFNMTAYPRDQERMDKLCGFLGMTQDEIFPDIFKDKDFLSLKKNITFYKQVDPETLLDGKGFEALPAPTGETDHTMINNLWKVLEKLGYRHRQILIKRYGLDGHPAQTYEQIAKDFNVTKERIRQLEQKAIRILQQPFHRIDLQEAE